MSLIENIRTKRSICEKSLNTYVNSLQIIKEELGLNSKLENSKFLQDYDKINIIIDKIPKITTKKNKLTAIIVGLDADPKFNDKPLMEKYQKKLKDLNDEYVEFLKTQTKTATQKKNWIEYEELVNIANDLIKKVKKFKTRKLLNKHEFETLQNAIMLKTHLEFPLRNDLSELKITTKDDYEKKTEKELEENNWLVIDNNKMRFIYNNFKNSKRLGQKIYNIPANLVNLYKIWFKFNTSDSFLVKKTNRTQSINSNIQTKYFNSLFKDYYPDKKISSSLIRHIVISHFSKDEPTILEEEQKEHDIENKYMHSATINKTYRKID